MIHKRGHLIKLERDDQIFESYIIMGSVDYSDLSELVHTLTPRELLEYKKIMVNKRRIEFCLGKYVGKMSAAKLTGSHSLRDLSIEKGVFNQPILCFNNNQRRNIQISLSHVNNKAISVAFPEEHPMGIDMEIVDQKNKEVIASQMLDSELHLIGFSSLSTLVGLTLLWTVKESLSKVLKTGLTTPLSVYSVSQVKKVETGYISEFTNFPQYKVFSWVTDKYVTSLCLPKNTLINIDIANLDLKPYYN